MIDWEMKSPRPVPPLSSLVVKNGSMILLLSSRDMPDPSSLTDNFYLGGGSIEAGLQPDATAPVRQCLAGVHQQVDDDLSELLAVALDPGDVFLQVEMKLTGKFVIS